MINYIFYLNFFVFLDPEGKPILVLAGEGHRDILFRTVSVALSYFKEKETLKTSTNKGILTEMVEKPDVNSLKFPGKVSNFISFYTL